MTDSGEQVATITKSISGISIPAAATARRAATSAISVAATCDMRRSLMPLRLVIHSSLVSTIRSRSELLSTVGGRAFPQPVISA